jgi:dipeptidyl aminopeptidase/acylaminoacyl peptidase
MGNSVLALAAAVAAASPASSSCDAGASSGTVREGQMVEAQDLLNLGEIGSAGSSAAPFSLSPDGRKIAVAVRQAVPASNGYCTRIIVVDTEKNRTRQIAQIDGSVILRRGDTGPLTDFSPGVPETLVPKWSPDGKAIAYLEKRAGVVQIMLNTLGGEESRQISASAVDIGDFEWRANKIIYSSRPQSEEATAAVSREGRSGYRYDERWAPIWQSRPFPAATPTRFHSIDPLTGDTNPVDVDALPRDNARIAVNGGNMANIVPRDTTFLNSPDEIRIALEGSAERICSTAVCEGASRIWWKPGGPEAYFLRRAGWGKSLTQIVRIDTRSMQTKILLQTEDNIGGCKAAPAALVCAIDGPLQPVRVETIDYANGKRRTLFDPNPGWAGLRKGKTRLLHLRTGRGGETFGRLVLPPDFDGKKKLPLVIVGYNARGFLKGGSGDLFPILPMASEGLAVFVYSLPPYVGYETPVRDQAEADRKAYTGLLELKSVVSAINDGIDLLVRDDLVDRDRVGLTGFSAGVMAAAHALRDGARFKAVSLSACCSDPFIREVIVGPHLGKLASDMGLPRLRYGEPAGEEDYGLAAVAARIEAPILIQAGDREYLMALEGEAAFRRLGKPFELYVYPDEYHNLWQPAHRQAAYARNIAWFDHYLLGKGNAWAERVLKAQDQAGSRPEQEAISE